LVKAFVGTSGWLYSWNQGGDLSWYVDNGGLKAVELNASFYRFPFPSQVKGWAGIGRRLKWAVKVHRLVTHVHWFKRKGFQAFLRLREIFEPVDPLVRFYLFQLPPRATPRIRGDVEVFFRKSGLQARFALEPRNQQWFADEHFRWARNLGLTWVSVDAPDLPRSLIRTSPFLYLRMHGRAAWYCHDYTPDELRSVARGLRAAGGRQAYVFFNNDHAMLRNAQFMARLLDTHA